MRRDEIMLTAIAGAGEFGLKPVNLQHLAFRIGRSGLPELEEGYYEFTPGHLGPRSRELDQNLEEMNRHRLTLRVCAPGHAWHETMVSSAGFQRAEGLGELMRPETREYIREIARCAMERDTMELVQSIRETDPEYAENSVLQDPGQQEND